MKHSFLTIYFITVLLCAVHSGVMGWIQQQQPSSIRSTTQWMTSVQTPTMLPPRIVSERVFQTDQRPVVLFDGVCNLCNNAVNLALDWDPQGRLRFAALQSAVGRSLLQTHGRRADDISSIVLVNADGAYIKSDAILKITEALSPPFLPAREVAMLGRLFVPAVLRDLIYDQVADNRYQLMGKRDTCRFDADNEFVDRFVPDSLAYE
jgi:predicted DCC family thiol-disulfide oxidoreductase YuxK